jgi:hypothetical protein
MEDVKTIGGNDTWSLSRLQLFPPAQGPAGNGVLFTRAEIEQYEWLDK